MTLIKIFKFNIYFGIFYNFFLARVLIFKTNGDIFFSSRVNISLHVIKEESMWLDLVEAVVWNYYYYYFRFDAINVYLQYK